MGQGYRYSFDPQVIDSFYAFGEHFRAVTNENTTTNPAHTILDVALNRVEADGELALPEGWDTSTLREIYGDVTRFGAETPIYRDQALGLSFLGRQILALNEQGKIQPSLDSAPFAQKESKVIARLIEEVAQAVPQDQLPD